jgi:calcium-binding protein CML
VQGLSLYVQHSSSLNSYSASFTGTQEFKRRDTVTSIGSNGPKNKPPVHHGAQAGRKNSSFHNFYKNVFVSDNLASNGSYNSILEELSHDSSTRNTFADKDFKLPDLEVQIGMDLNDVLLHDKHKKQLKKMAHEIKRERVCLSRLDKLAQTSNEDLGMTNITGMKLSASATRKLRVKLECEAELNTIRQIVTRKPGELVDKLQALKEQIESESLNGIDDDHRESSIDHPQLDSVHEKMEDLRQEACEMWCKSRGKEINEKYTNLEKRMLRKWFKELDYDGSGEVNVEELQDPMLSSGILKTREQVVRVLANVDRNGTMGIDFEEFLIALSANKLADKSKLKKLQEMSLHPHFSVDTLITAERRKKLFKSIIKQCQSRQAEIDRLYKKYDRPRLGRKEREQWMHELDELEEKQARSIFLHSKYLHALDGVLQDKKALGETLKQEHEAQRRLEATMHDSLDTLMRRPGAHLSGSALAAAAAGAGGEVVDAEDAAVLSKFDKLLHTAGGGGGGIAGGGGGGSVSSHHSFATYSMGSNNGAAQFQVERLHNPYNIYAPPTPKYNNTKKKLI